MEIESLSRSVKAASLPLDKLAVSTQVSEREKIAEVSRQFEAVLLKQILSQAQRPLFQGPLTGGGGAAGSIYQDMVTQQLAERISQGGSFGFARVLEKQLTSQHLKKEPEATAVEPPKAQARPQPGKRV